MNIQVLRLFRAILVLGLLVPAACHPWKRPDYGPLIDEARPLIAGITVYRRKTGEFPADFVQAGLGGPTQRPGEPDILNGWHYHRKQEGFMLGKSTGHLKDILWYQCNSHESLGEWYLDTDTGGPWEHIMTEPQH